MSTVTWVTGRNEPRSTRMLFLYKASAGWTMRPSGMNIAALVSPFSTN